MTPSKNYVSIRQRISRNLVRLRALKGLSQEQLADLAGLHRAYVGHIEQMKRNATIENLEKLALALDADPVELFRPETALEHPKATRAKASST